MTLFYCSCRWGVSDTPVGGGQGKGIEAENPGSGMDQQGVRWAQAHAGMLGSLISEVFRYRRSENGTENLSVARFAALGKV